MTKETWRFKEDSDDYLYLRDVSRLIATERRQKRLVLSGEVISSVSELENVLKQKLSMQSTNVRKAFRSLDRDYSGRLDRYEFRRFLENLNIHCTLEAFNETFALLDGDDSGSVEFNEFMKNFGPSIAGEKLRPLQLDGQERAANKLALHVGRRDARAGRVKFTAEQARLQLTEKLATMGSSVRRIFAHANEDYQRAGEAEGGLDYREFKLLLDKFNIPMTDAEYRKLYRMVDPDGSGMVSYSEFQKEFGTSISGGSQSIRWGMTALPKNFKTAKAWDEAAVNAELHVSGPEVSASGSIVTKDEVEKGTGLLVQKVSDIFGSSKKHETEFEREMKIQHRLGHLESKRKSVDPAEWDNFVARERKKVIDKLDAEEAAEAAKTAALALAAANTEKGEVAPVVGKRGLFRHSGGGRSSSRPTTPGELLSAMGYGTSGRAAPGCGGAGGGGCAGGGGGGGGGAPFKNVGQEQEEGKRRSGGSGILPHGMAIGVRKMTKADAMLHRRQTRALAKSMAETKPSFGSGAGARSLSASSPSPLALSAATGNSFTASGGGGKATSGGGGGRGGAPSSKGGGAPPPSASRPTSTFKAALGGAKSSRQAAGEGGGAELQQQEEEEGGGTWVWVPGGMGASQQRGYSFGGGPGGAGGGPASSAAAAGSSSAASMTARPNTSHESAARMRDALERAQRQQAQAQSMRLQLATHKTKHRQQTPHKQQQQQQQQQSSRKTQPAIHPVLTSGVMLGERPGLPADATALTVSGTASLSRPGTASFSRPGTASLSRPGTASFSRPGTASLSRPGTASFSRSH